MKQFTIQVVALLIVAFGALILTFNSDLLNGLTQKTTTSSSSTEGVSQLKIGDNLINVEVADTQSKRQTGLSNRDQLASSSGMLFVFTDTDKHSFWMKQVRFPLDFIWILNDQIVDITQNVPPPAANQPDESLPIYQSNSQTNKVLEVNAGFAAAHNIQAGDKVILIGN